MDYELLVEPHIEDGKSLIAELSRAGFDVSVAVWVKASEDGHWSLYIGSKSVGSLPLADAYRAVYSAWRDIPSPSIDFSDIKLVEPSDPIAASAMQIRDRYPARLPTRYRGPVLGGKSIDEAYIYPRPTGPMSVNEVVQTVAGLMNRTGALAPSMITLRDGTQIQAVPVGIQMNPPGGVQIILQDLNAGTNRSISADDVVSIL
jgi:hypothetical protein